jgi:hypothetical protein
MNVLYFLFVFIKLFLSLHSYPTCPSQFHHSVGCSKFVGNSLTDDSSEGFWLICKTLPRAATLFPLKATTLAAKTQSER